MRRGGRPGFPLPCLPYGLSSWDISYISADWAYTAVNCDETNLPHSFSCSPLGRSSYGNLSYFTEVAPFVRWYRSEAEVVEYAREVAALSGAHSPREPTTVEVPKRGSDGKVTSRKIFIMLQPVVNGYRSEHVNHTTVKIDAKERRVSEVTQ